MASLDSSSKYETNPILYRLFQEKEKERILPNLFNEVSINLIQNLARVFTRKENNILS